LLEKARSSHTFRSVEQSYDSKESMFPCLAKKLSLGKSYPANQEEAFQG